MYIVIAILAFGILIASHELGHFTAAKLCGVKVNEFAIGIGPALFKKQKGETLYSLRLLPIGGYCAMEGEDEESPDPRAFTSQPAWKRIIILVAGATVNFLVGLIIVMIIFARFNSFSGTTIMEFADGFPLTDRLSVGDVVYKINGERIYYADDFSTFMSRAGDTVDMVVVRDGQKVTLDDLPLQVREYDGVMRYGLTFNRIKATFTTKLQYSWYTATNFVRLVRLSLTDLITGSVGVKDLSGVVGIFDTINEVGEQSETRSDAFLNIAYLCAFIAVNLAVMNMLPIPALDGGRVFLLIVTVIIEKITGKHINPKYEAYIHAIGMILLLALMAYVMFNDIVRIFNG
jgi:regulator of sigma E protease